MTVETAEAPAGTIEAHTELPLAQWKRGDPTPHLNKALSLLQGKLPRIPKSKDVKVEGKEGKRGFSYSYAELADVALAVGPLLAEFGLAFHTAPTRDPEDRRLMILEWFLLHESGEERSGEWPLGPANQSSQSLGSAITYGRRYTLGTATGAVTEDDDDGQAAQQAHGGRSATDPWDGASKDRPQGNARGGNRQDGPRADPVAQALAKLAVQIAADPTKTAADLHELVSKQAAGKQKLDAMVPNPFGDGQVKLRDVLREAGSRMESGQHEDERGHGPAEAMAEASPPDGETSSSADDAPDPESAFVIAYIGRVGDATEDGQLVAMRPEIGSAVKDRIISPKVAADLSGAVSARRRELADAVAS